MVRSLALTVPELECAFLRGFALRAFLSQGCYEHPTTVRARGAMPQSVGDLGMWVYTGLYIHSYFRVPLVVFDHTHDFRVCMLSECLFLVESFFFNIFLSSISTFAVAWLIIHT